MTERPTSESPPPDDELTTDVDPAWLDAVLDWHRGTSPDGEITIGSDDDTPTPPRGIAAVRPSFPQPPPPSRPSSPTPPSPPTSPATSSPPSGPPPPPGRWQPTDRIKASSAVVDAEAILPAMQPNAGLDRTKVVLAGIVALAVVGVVWLLSSNGGGGGETPATTVPSTAVVSSAAPVGSGPGS